MDTSDLTDTTNQDSAELQKVTLMNIQQLQVMEQKLYKKLETIAANDPANTGAQDEIISKINELSQMRMTMFSQLEDMYRGLQGRVAQSRVDLVDQMTVTGVVEGQLNAAKDSLNQLTNSKNQKMRMVEINTYYSQKYRAQTDLVKTILMFAIPCLVLAILQKKGFVPKNIGNLAMAIIIAVGIVIVFRKYWDISSRSNMVFDEYKWSWDPAANKPTVLEYDLDQLKKAGSSLEDEANTFVQQLGLGCLGKECCDTGTTFSSVTQKCEPNTNKEGFSGIAAGALAAGAVAYMESRNPVCPWKNSPGVVKPFSQGDNYVRI